MPAFISETLQAFPCYRGMTCHTQSQQEWKSVFYTCCVLCQRWLNSVMGIMLVELLDLSTHLHTSRGETSWSLFLASPVSPRSNRSWWGSAAWWRNPNPSPWPRSWRGSAGLSTSPWSFSQRTSFLMSLWTNGLCVIASSPSTPKVPIILTNYEVALGQHFFWIVCNCSAGA